MARCVAAELDQSPSEVSCAWARRPTPCAESSQPGYWDRVPTVRRVRNRCRSSSGAHSRNAPRVARGRRVPVRPAEGPDLAGLSAARPAASATVARLGLRAARFAHLETQHAGPAVACPLERIAGLLGGLPEPSFERTTGQ